MAMVGAGGRRGVAVARVVAVVVVGLEALALCGVAVYSVVHAVRESADPAFAVGLGAVAAMFAVALGWCTLALARHRRGARAPALTWQILQVAAAFYAASEATAIAAVAAVLAAAGAMAILVIARDDPSL